MTDAAPAPRPLPGPAALVAVMAAALALDQVTKWLIVAVVMQPPRLIPVVPGLNLTLGFNEGSSFGLLSDVMAGRPVVMAALTGALTLVFAVLAFRARQTLERAGLALVVGGSLGNIVDRLRHGAVTDFLDIYRGGWHWPTFNVADMAIALGAVLILAASLVSRRRRTTVSDQA